MDAARFDTLTLRLTTELNRRRSLGLLALLGLSGLGASDLAAAKKKKSCPPCKRRKKGTCKGKKPDGTACPGGTCVGGNCRTATCSDGFKNGTETGVDCGGTCPRCGVGHGCLGRPECASAVCTSGICQTCTPLTACAAAGA